MNIKDKYDSIIFDLDGTLWNSSKPICEAWNIILKRHKEITRKPKETTKYKYVYKSNVNTLIGNIKEEMPRLLTDDKEEIKQIVEEILDIARKDLVYTKIKAPTNKERDKKKYYHKKCKSNIQNSF